MRRYFSSLLLVCFVVISASFSYAKATDHHGSQPQVSIAANDISFVASVTSSATAKFGDPGSKTSKDECACKEKTGATKFVCSVTLAFSGNAEFLHSPAKSKARYAIAKSTVLQSHIDELKRPPRTIL